MNSLTIKDETASGNLLNQILLQFEKERITVQELISARILEEVQRHNHSFDQFTNNLVVPSNLEQRLNKKDRQEIDIERQTYIALDAFKKNGFFILIDDEQVEELDEEFLINETTEVSFIKLTPLVGG